MPISFSLRELVVDFTGAVSYWTFHWAAVEPLVETGPRHSFGIAENISVMD